MTRVVVALVALFLTYAAPATAQGRVDPSTARSAKGEQELLDLSRTKWRWMSERKVDTLAARFHDQAVFVHIGGSMSRNQELEVIRSGGIHYKHGVRAAERNVEAGIALVHPAPAVASGSEP